jgi:hypothetical protein
MSWQEAARRLEELRSQGEPYPGYRELKKRLKCSLMLIGKAIKSSDELKKWAQRPAAKPRAAGQPRSREGTEEDSGNDAVFENTAQSRELDPEDAAAIKEYRERLEPEELVWFDSLSTEDQITVVNDPDAGDRAYPRG